MVVNGLQILEEDGIRFSKDKQKPLSAGSRDLGRILSGVQNAGYELLASLRFLCCSLVTASDRCEEGPWVLLQSMFSLFRVPGSSNCIFLDTLFVDQQLLRMERIKGRKAHESSKADV